MAPNSKRGKEPRNDAKGVGKNPSVSGEATRCERRQLLHAVGVMGVVSIAGCLGSDDDSGGETVADSVDNSESADTEDDDPIDGDGVDAPETGVDDDSDDNDPIGDDGRDDVDGGIDDDAADDVDNGAEDADEEGTDTDEEDEATHSADLDIDPEDGWGEPHDGVEVPDEPGRAVLVIDGDRHELGGACQGGEVHAADEDEEHEMRAEHGHFVFDSAYHMDGEEVLAASVTRIVGIERIAGISDRSRTVAEFDQFALLGEDSGAVYQFLRYGDGESETLDDDGVTEADESFVRIDPSGVITAIGELEHVESGLDSNIEEVPTGEFEFGARCQGEWDENWGEQ